jgi:hypothetical protein
MNSFLSVTTTVPMFPSSEEMNLFGLSNAFLPPFSIEVPDYTYVGLRPGCCDANKLQQVCNIIYFLQVLGVLLKNAIMPETPSERDPLIQRNPSHTNNHHELPKRVESRRPGPFEISRTTRYGILAGMWSANFLAVCRTLLPHVSSYLPFCSFEGLKSYCPCYLVSTGHATDHT